jgi:hypothetical protein
MSTLSVYPTSTASWQSLILEAQTASHIDLSEDLQSYLVFLLMRFLNETKLSDKPIAVDFLETLYQHGHLQQSNLREVGDKCLIISGFFPGLAERRFVEINYYVSLGQGAYSALSHLTGKSDAYLYGNLSRGFVLLMDILQTIRSMNADKPLLTPLAAADLLEIHQTSDRARFIKILTRQ